MKVICVIVASIDGKTTKNNNPDIYHWSSKEDQNHFFSLIEKNHLLLMGRHTYEHAKHMMKHKKGRLRVVLTSKPKQFTKEEIPDMLEFTNEKPTQLLTRLSTLGYKRALLLGGSSTNTLFFQENCVDELWLTLEPYLFGKGKPLVGQEVLNTHLQLISTKKFNNKGTLLLKYRILT